MCSATPSIAGAYNFWIDVKYNRVVPDRKNHRVVVDLIETIVSSNLNAYTNRAGTSEIAGFSCITDAESMVDAFPLPGHPHPSASARGVGHRSTSRPDHKGCAHLHLPRRPHLLGGKLPGAESSVDPGSSAPVPAIFETLGRSGCSNFWFINICTANANAKLSCHRARKLILTEKRIEAPADRVRYYLIGIGLRVVVQVEHMQQLETLVLEALAFASK